MSEYDIFSTFDQIGEIERIRKSDDKFEVLFDHLMAPPVRVTANASDASAAQPAKRQKTDNKESDESAPDKSDSPMPATVATDLDDHCWMEIMERLHTRDLYEVANTGKRFHAMATRVFHARYKNSQFERHSLRYDYTRVSLSLFVHAIRTFTPKRICIDACDPNENILLRTVIEHCADLEELDIGFFWKLQPETIEALQPLLPQLKRLKINAAYLPQTSDCTEWKTEELSITLDSRPPALNIKIPTLTKLTFCSKVYINYAFIFGVIANHPQIEALEFACVTISSNELWSLPEYAPNIKSLSFSHVWSTGNASDRKVAVFKHLKQCVIRGTGEGDSDVLLRLLDGSPIEQLTVQNVPDLALIEDICRFTTITHLVIEMEEDYLPVSQHQWTQLAQALKQLRSLQTHGIDNTFGSVKCILQHSASLNNLDISAPQLELIAAECEAISALIVARPGLRVRIDAGNLLTDVSRTYSFNLADLIHV